MASGRRTRGGGHAGNVFGYLLATSGAVALFVYLTIAASQLVIGRRRRAAGESTPVRMSLFP